MKRVHFILLATMLVGRGVSFGQITSLGGELRYEHQYEDVLTDGSFSTSIRSNPILNLGAGGFLLSPRILDFTLRTSLNLSYGTTHNRDLTFTNQQSYWNAYDANLDFFRYSSIKFQFAARDHIIDTQSDFGSLSNFHGRTRSQEQRAQLGIDKIPFLPSISIFFIQNRSWALTGDPSEQVSHQLSFSVASAAGQVSSANLSGSFTDLKERYTGFSDKIATLQFTGAKEFSANHRVDVTAEYYRYSEYGNLNGSLGYIGLLNDKLRISTGLSGTQSNSGYSTYRNIGASQGINLASGDYYRFGLSVNGSAGKYVSLSSQSVSYNRTFGSGVSAHHNRTVGNFTLTNDFSAGYSVRDYGETYKVWEGGIANSASTTAGAFSLTGSYDFSAQSTRNSISWYSFSNNAAFIANGTLSRVVHSQSSIRYRSDDFGGDLALNRNQHNLNFTQGFDGQFVYYIPMTLGAGGSVNWYFSSLIDRTYGWYLTFTSPAFFVRSLFANYRYTRNFDPYYRREIAEHNGTFNYQLRALALQLRFRYVSFPSRVRDITFTVSRPF